MDAKSLSFSLALMGAAFALLTVVLASLRRERGLSIYAGAFVSAMLSFLLFMFQGRLSPWIGVVFANLMLVFYQFGLAWGLRTCIGIEPRWPRRFYLYLAVWLSAVIGATFAVDSFFLRALLSSTFVILGSLEFLFPFRLKAGSFPPAVKILAFAVVLCFAGFHAARIALIVATTSSDTRLMDGNAVSAFTFSFSIFFSVLWLGLILIIDNAGLLSEVERKNAQLEAQAGTDELTGLSNRHLLEMKLGTEIERAGRYREPLSLILFDIDHFKRVNDDWGHQVGDEILRQLASLTREHIREPDNLFRWGGEEFLILAPHTDLEGAGALAEKLRRSIEAHRFPPVGSVTVSFGVAEWSAPMDRDQWFERVDHALYRAKNGGRNRVVCFGAADRLPVALVKMEWRQAWESGDPTIDAEHRELLELYNNLLDLSLSCADAATLREHLGAVLEHIVGHFADEERVLAEVGYPDLEAHAGLHRELLAGAMDLKARTERGECAPAAFFDFLVGKVVYGHMLDSDAVFFPYTRRHRSSAVPAV